MDGRSNEAPWGPSDAAELPGLCKKISAPKPAKDALIKALKQLSSLLDRAPQDPEELGAARDDVPRAVTSLLAGSNSDDRDVRIYLALCVVHLLRIWAPNTPFEDDTETMEVRDCGQSSRRGAAVACAQRAARASNRASGGGASFFTQQHGQQPGHISPSGTLPSFQEWRACCARGSRTGTEAFTCSRRRRRRCLALPAAVASLCPTAATHCRASHTAHHTPHLTHRRRCSRCSGLSRACRTTTGRCLRRQSRC